MNRVSVLLAAMVFTLPHYPRQSPVQIKRLDGTVVSGGQLDSVLGRTLTIPGVVTAAAAVVHNDRIVYNHAVGVLKVGGKTAASPETVFRAASLSKPVFAYLVLKLADELVLELDRPLCEYLSKPLPEYPGYSDLATETRWRAITARMVLSHTTGFPNWRWQNPDKKLTMMFNPGAGFSYSGEAYCYLQFIVESLTGRGLEDLAREKVFIPLEMGRSSYVWQPRFDGSFAVDLEGIPPVFREKIRTEANAAGSLLTTAADYARFLLAAMNGKGLRRATHAVMLRSHVTISARSLFGAQSSESTEGNRYEGLAWALGWGAFRSTYGAAYFHVGAEPGFENYVAYFVDQKTGYVLLSSGEGFEGVMRQAAPRLIGDTVSPFKWLGY